jgi:DNA (cytosine-5)-methyltransferase 1
MVYYNEIDPYAAQWLRNLIAAGLIADGEVDERSIVDVRGSDLRGYRQCHFFAGIGVWSYALRLAGWRDDEPVWTGSCPCQPFSAAGRKGGLSDERHLWPHWQRLIGEREPDVIFGEQVASADGLAWLDFVCADLEAAGYAVGAVDTCAAGVGAPHIRQRLFFVGHALDQSREWDTGSVSGTQAQVDGARVTVDGCMSVGPCDASASVAAGELGHHHHPGLQGRGVPGAVGERQRGSECVARAAGAVDCAVGDAAGRGFGVRRSAPGESGRASQPNATNGFWHPADWLPCIDGKARPVEPGTFPLAHGAPARVGRLRAYGNAIVAPVAAEFIGSYMETRMDKSASPGARE